MGEDTISAEEIRAPSLKDQLDAIPTQNFLEKYNKDIAKMVASIDQADIEALENTVQQVAEHANKSDLIITTGRSRSLPNALLIAGGVPKEKIVEFNCHLNSIVYKSEDPQYSQYSDEDRIRLLSDELTKPGISLNESEPKSVCVVDDRVRSGGKALEFLKVFSRIKGIGDFSFAAYTSQFGMDRLKSYVASHGQDSSKIFLPELKVTNENRARVQRNHLILDALSYLCTVTSSESNPLDHGVSKHLQPLLKSITDEALAKFTSASNLHTQPKANGSHINNF